MAMRTAANFISRRLFSGTRNLTEKAKTTLENPHSDVIGEIPKGNGSTKDGFVWGICKAAMTGWFIAQVCNYEIERVQNDKTLARNKRFKQIMEKYDMQLE